MQIQTVKDDLDSIYGRLGLTTPKGRAAEVARRALAASSYLRGSEAISPVRSWC